MTFVSYIVGKRRCSDVLSHAEKLAPGPGLSTSLKVSFLLRTYTHARARAHTHTHTHTHRWTRQIGVLRSCLTSVSRVQFYRCSEMHYLKYVLTHLQRYALVDSPQTHPDEPCHHHSARLSETSITATASWNGSLSVLSAPKIPTEDNVTNRSISFPRIYKNSSFQVMHCAHFQHSGHCFVVFLDSDAL